MHTSKLNHIYCADLFLSVPLVRSPSRPPGLSVGPTAPTQNLPLSVKMAGSPVLAATGPGVGASILQSPVTPAKRYPASGSTTPAPIPTVYKYIRNKAGIVGTITNPAGITSTITNDDVATIGSSRAQYLNVHGYGSDEIAHIVDAFRRATDVHGFTALAGECGMALAELEWFWSLS